MLIYNKKEKLKVAFQLQDVGVFGYNIRTVYVIYLTKKFIKGLNMIRKPNIKDVSRIAEIHTYGWRFAYKNIFSTEYLYNNHQVLKASEMHKQIITTKIDMIDIFDDGIIKGFVLHNNSRDEDLPEAYEISAIYVEPEFTRSGVGKELLAAAEIQCRKKGMSKLFLWVLEENTMGRTFYEKYGYRFDETEKYIGDLNVKELRYSKEITNIN
jgi:diamine N-acetyltransferase